MRATPTPPAGRLALAGLVLVAGLSAGGCKTSLGAASVDPATALPPMAPATASGDTRHPLDATVARLRSPDFVERSQAAAMLVSAGSAALPALGRAGDQPAAVAGGMRVSTTRPVVESILASADVDTLVRELRSAWVVVRRGAADELGRRGRWGPIPALIARLEDPDSQVRDASAASLRRLTNNFFGYDPRSGSRRREVAAQRWRTWWRQEGRLKAATGRDGVTQVSAR